MKLDTCGDAFVKRGTIHQGYNDDWNETETKMIEWDCCEMFWEDRNEVKCEEVKTCTEILGYFYSQVNNTRKNSQKQFLTLLNPEYFRTCLSSSQFTFYS